MRRGEGQGEPTTRTRGRYDREEKKRKRKETVAIGTWNIRDGRGGGIESACRALEASNVDVCVMQESKIVGNIYTRLSAGYSVVCSKAGSSHQGGVALCHRENENFEVEEHRFHGPNVVSFRLIIGGEGWYCIGGYIPPSEKSEETLDQLRGAVGHRPKGFRLVVMGDFNVDLATPRDSREDGVAEQCDEWGLGCMSTHFAQRKSRRSNGR